jgi:hypothetical protein
VTIPAPAASSAIALAAPIVQNVFRIVQATDGGEAMQVERLVQQRGALASERSLLNP